MSFSGMGTSIVQVFIFIILLIGIVGTVKWIRYMNVKKKVLELQHQKLKEE